MLIDTLEFKLDEDTEYYANLELIPTRAHSTDAGLDLRSKDKMGLPIARRVLVGTGVRVKIPQGYVGLLLPRSSLSKKNIIMTNSCGVIDSDYRGEIMASLMYTGNPEDDKEFQTIEQYERIVQLLVIPIAIPSVIISTQNSENWNDTTRGTGGFGSTGK